MQSQLGHGKFIVVEGLEGAGKTTAMETLRHCLETKVPSLVLTREPGGTTIGEMVRTLIKNVNHDHQLEDEAELLLLYAARVQHVKQLIKPALARGSWVLSDRFELSSYAYQGGGRGLSLDFIQQISKTSLNGFCPDLTFFLDIEPRVGLERVHKRGEADRMERESLLFFERVSSTYQTLIQGMKHVVVIDANQSLSDVQKSIIGHIQHFLDDEHG